MKLQQRFIKKTLKDVLSACAVQFHVEVVDRTSHAHRAASTWDLRGSTPVKGAKLELSLAPNIAQTAGTEN